jgi:uncharacterized damage-inducible protein DinB
MEPAALAKLYAINVQSLKLNTEGVSHEESVRPPSEGGNSLNWVLGHIVANRNGILDLVGAPPIWSEELATPYERGSTPLDPGAAQPLNRILADLDRAQETLTRRLGEIGSADLAAQRGKSTVGEQLAFLQFHEAYHAGQVGLLRRLLGKPGAIR